MSSKNQIIARARQIAEGRGADPHNNPVIDAGMTAEALVPHAIRFVINRAAADGDIADFFEEHSIEIGHTAVYLNLSDRHAYGLVNTYGTLPDRILRRHLTSSFVRGFRDNSYLPATADFRRSRFDNLLCYYTIRTNKIEYSCEPGKKRAFTTTASTALTTSKTVNLTGANFAVGEQGERLKLVNTSGKVIIDAFMETINTVTPGADFYGKPVLAATGVLTGTIITSEYYVVSRALTSVNTTDGSATVTCAGGAFAAADVGRRLKISVSGTVILDSIIAKVNSGTSIDLYAAATATTAVGTADVMYQPLLLNAVSTPAMPTAVTDDIALSARFTEDVVLALAGALTGEFKMSALLGGDEDE